MNLAGALAPSLFLSRFGVGRTSSDTACSSSNLEFFPDVPETVHICVVLCCSLDPCAGAFAAGGVFCTQDMPMRALHVRLAGGTACEPQLRCTPLFPASMRSPLRAALMSVYGPRRNFSRGCRFGTCLPHYVTLAGCA